MKTVKLSRNKIYLIGVTVILLFVIINRANFIYGSKFTTGKVIRIGKLSIQEYGHVGTSMSVPIIQFFNNSNVITIEGEKNADLTIGEEVKVVYKKDNPESAAVFSFGGFLVPGLLYSLIPLLLISAATFSFLDPSDLIVIDVGKFYSINLKKEKTNKIIKR
jgi:hypothetical protein